MPRFTFKEAAASDRERIHKWLSQDYIKTWLYGPGLQKTLDDLELSFTGHAFFKHWVAQDSTTPFAYLLTSNIDKNGNDVYARACTQEGKAITLDVLICDPSYIGKGLAHTLIQEFLATFTDITEVLIDPEVKNSRAVHVYQKAGFKIVSEFIPPHNPVPHYMMQKTLT